MASRISVECPGCLAKVALPDSSKLGKKVKCPKCSDIFVAESAEDEESDEADDDAPAQSKSRKRPAAAAASARGGKKRKSSGGSSGGGGSTGPLIAGGAVAVVALIGVGLWLSGVFSSKPPAAPPIAQPEPVAAAPMVAHAPPAPPTPPAPPAVSPTERTLALRWLPQDTELILHVKVADLWQAPLLKGLVDSPTAAPGIKEFQAATGLLPTDVESVTMGLGDIRQLQNVAASSMLGMPPQPPKAIAIVRTKKPVSMDEILKAAPELKTAEYKSKNYVESTNNEYCSWLAEPSTLIIAKSEDLKAIMDRGETSTPRKELMFADATPHVVVLFAPKDPKSLSQGRMASVPGISPAMAAMQKTLDESFTAFSLGVNIRGGFDVQTSLLLKDSEGATTVKSGVETSFVEARKAFDTFKMTGQPLLIELGEQLLNNLRVEAKDQVVKVTTNLPDSDQQKIEQVPPLVMMLAMTGGLGGGGGPLAGPRGMQGSMSGPPGDFTGVPPNAPVLATEALVGETDPVRAVQADGIPEGTSLTVKSSWSRVPDYDGSKPVHKMRLIFDLTGDNLDQICGFGQFAMKDAILTDGGNLKVSRSQPGPNVLKGLQPFEPEEGIGVDHPDGTLRLSVVVDVPPEGVNSVTLMEGTFQLLLAEGSETFAIQDVPKTAKRPLIEPELKAAGVKLVKSNDSTGEALTISCGKGFFLGKVKAEIAGPEYLGISPVSFSEYQKNQTVQRFLALNSGRKFPDKLAIDVKVFKGVKEATVAFKFENVALPSAESRPVPKSGNAPQQPNGPGPVGQPVPGQP